MMLATALELAKLVQGQHGITWTNTLAVNAYIGRLQTVVEKLANENNKLAWYHSRMIEKVNLNTCRIIIIRAGNILYFF